MALFRALMIFAALVALASLPCVIAMLVVGMDDLTHRTGGVVDRLRSLKIQGQSPGEWWPLAPDYEDSIEQIAADLRELSQALRGDPALLGSNGPERAVRYTAILAAYETRLQDACRALNVPEQLDDLTGVDREIERVRIEGLLQAQGLVLRSARSRGRE